MAIDTSTLEATLQNKFDNVTDPKEMLLLGKAYEATVGGIAVSDIEDAGAAQVAEINSVATNTFKTVGGTSILGTGDIATLPSQTSNAGKYLTTDGTTASWGEVTQKVLQVATTTTTGATFMNSTISWNSNLNSYGATHQSITFTPVSATSTLLIYTNAIAGIEGNARGYQGIRHDGTIVGWLSMNGYGADTGGGTCSAVVASGNTNARVIEHRALGTSDGGAGMTLGRAQGNGTTNRYYPEISSMHIIEVEV